MRIFVAASLALVLGAPSASQKVPLAKGIFLVAKPSIASGPFYKSVVLLLSHGDEGTLGLIVTLSADRCTPVLCLNLSQHAPPRVNSAS